MGGSDGSCRQLMAGCMPLALGRKCIGLRPVVGGSDGRFIPLLALIKSFGE